jgi:hypothetical protein
MEPGVTVAGVVYIGQPVGSSPVGDFGHTSHFKFSLFAYDALGAASTAVFFGGGVASDGTPPSHEHVVSLRTMGLFTMGPPPLLDVDPPLPPELPPLEPASLVALGVDVPQWVTPVTTARLIAEMTVTAHKVCASFMSFAPWKTAPHNPSK